MAWNANIARFWRNYVPPCRPSRSDLDTCSIVVAEIRRSVSRRPRVLILGSTTEFRDWAFEERVDALVVDSSREYHQAVSAELTHRNPYESVEYSDWRSMDVGDDFDLAVGDLAVGQIPHSDLNQFLGRVAASLGPDGYFLTKSFFDPEIGEAPELLDVLGRLQDPSSTFCDPFPLVAHDLTLACTDRATGVLHFEKMFRDLEECWMSGHLSDLHMERFREFGWDTAMKVEFSVPTLKAWRSSFSAFFEEVAGHEVTEDAVPSMPLFVLKKL